MIRKRESASMQKKWSHFEQSIWDEISNTNDSAVRLLPTKHQATCYLRIMAANTDRVCEYSEGKLSRAIPY